MPIAPDCDLERITCMLVILSGCIVVMGAAVATLSLLISLYMSHEETFRSRFRLIMREMEESHVPPSLRDKVKTFYLMYWHKRRAVSQAQLLLTFPPTLPATVYTDIYFEATQKSRLLRELSYQFLSELSKKMETIHYIPRDAIIKRGSRKSAIIFFTYGDIEMLTAEDDSTAILRLTRGTILTPCGVVAPVAMSRSHLTVRAASFCTAQLLHIADLWRVVNRHTSTQDNASHILDAFTEHIEKVKRHYHMKIPISNVYKSSILHFNRNLMALKELKDANGNSLLADTEVFLEIAGCYIMRNRLGSTLTDESDAICLRPTFPCILQPNSSLLLTWQLLVASLVLLVCITHPYFLIFRKTVPVTFKFFDYVVTAIFVVDQIAHLSTGAQVEEGVPISFTQTSSQQIRSHWFVLDVVSTLPIFEFIGDGHFAGINKILKLPKVFLVLKVVEDKYVYHSNVVRFCSYTLLLLIACYLIASMQQAFMCYQSGYCLVTNFTHSPFWEKQELDEETVAARITFGLYWAISMIMFTTHMETWGKENMSNMMYTMVILEVCIVLRTFMEAVYSGTIMVTSAMREAYDAHITTVKSFLIRNDVDPELRQRFITYLQLCWYTDKAYKMTHRKNESIFYDLPQHVYEDIVGRNRMKYILSIPLMKVLKKEELKQLAAKAYLFYTSPNEILQNTGDLVNEIYVVVRGTCEVLCPKTHQTIGKLHAMMHFGATACLLRIPAYNTIRAVTHVQMFCISKRHLNEVFANAQIKDAIDYVKTQQVYGRMHNPQPSFLKYVPLPLTPNREFFPLPRKHEPDFEYLHPFMRLGFFSILRYIFPRFTIRPDGKYLIRHEWFRVSCALLSAMVFPSYTYMVLQWPWLYYLTWLLDLSAVYDIFQRMLVGYYNKVGILVYHPSSTSAHYIKGAFIADLIGCLALENLESPTIENYENRYRVTPVRQFLMMNRLLQLYRFPSIVQTLPNYIERRDIRMMNRNKYVLEENVSWIYCICAIPLFILMFNILTCLMIFNSVKIYYITDEHGPSTWLLEPFEDEGGSWLDIFHNTFRFNMTSSPLNLHLATQFWVVYETTTTGYAKLKPSNIHLMGVLFIGMVMSAMIITYFSVRIISIRSNVNQPLAGFQQHMRDINTYMKREDIKQDLQNELRHYYEYNWDKMGGIDYSGVLKLCDQITLRNDAMLHIYGPTFAKCPLLAHADVSLLRMVGHSVRSVYFLRDMKIVEYDDVLKDLYFVDYGEAESRVPVGDMTQVVRLQKGSLFGNLEESPTQRVPMDIVATTRLHLLMINTKIFYNILNDFPATKALMAESRKADNPYYILGNIKNCKVKLVRGCVDRSATADKKGILKYIYFQEGLVLMYLIVVSLSCIFMDLYNAGYQDNRALFILMLYILDMLFFIKILLQFSLPHLVKSKNLITLLLLTRRLYFKREFKFDVISCIPIEFLSLQADENRWFWFSWLRLNRMFRIVTVYNCLKRHNERTNVNLTISTILTVSIWFSLFVHGTTCLWYFVGTLEEQAESKSSWMYNDEGVSWCYNDYICSLFFVITTFTQNGVGDIMPKKQSEVIFVTILMIISTMVFIMYVGEFSNIIQYQSFRSFSFYTKYLELQEYLKKNRVSMSLVSIVNKYTIHLWRESRGLQAPHFLKKAPHSLRLRVMYDAYGCHVSKNHMFEKCESAFLRQLVGCLRLYTYNAGMYVVKENEITDCMYVIHTGKVEETSEQIEEILPARVYPRGCFFGILQGLVRNTPYTHSYQTKTKSQVLTLHLDDWEYLLAHFPKSKAMIHNHMRNNYDRDMEPSKWPGGLDQDPPSRTEQAENDSNFSSYHKFLADSRLSEAGPSGLMRKQDSITSITSTVPSKSRLDLSDAYHLNLKVTGANTAENNRRINLPDRLVFESKNAVKDENQGLHQDNYHKMPKIGIIDKLVNTLKKLMGRYSDTDSDINNSETRDELLLEEEQEATQALLKQLDEARRLTYEKNRKSKIRSKRIVQREENTEKHLFTLDINNFNSDQSQQTTLFGRPVQLRDDDQAISHKQAAEISLKTDFVQSTKKASETVITTKAEADTSSHSIRMPEANSETVNSGINFTATSKVILDTKKPPNITLNESNNLSPSQDSNGSAEIETVISDSKISTHVMTLNLDFTEDSLTEVDLEIELQNQLKINNLSDFETISSDDHDKETFRNTDNLKAQNIAHATRPLNTQKMLGSDENAYIQNIPASEDIENVHDTQKPLLSQFDADLEDIPGSVSITNVSDAQSTVSSHDHIDNEDLLDVMVVTDVPDPLEKRILVDADVQSIPNAMDITNVQEETSHLPNQLDADLVDIPYTMEVSNEGTTQEILLSQNTVNFQGVAESLDITNMHNTEETAHIQFEVTFQSDQDIPDKDYVTNIQNTQDTSYSQVGIDQLDISAAVDVTNALDSQEVPSTRINGDLQDIRDSVDVINVLHSEVELVLRDIPDVYVAQETKQTQVDEDLKDSSGVEKSTNIRDKFARSDVGLTSHRENQETLHQIDATVLDVEESIKLTDSEEILKQTDVNMLEIPNSEKPKHDQHDVHVHFASASQTSLDVNIYSDNNPIDTQTVQNNRDQDNNDNDVITDIQPIAGNTENANVSSSPNDENKDQESS